jgi:hypothetical protein
MSDKGVFATIRFVPYGGQVKLKATILPTQLGIEDEVARCLLSHERVADSKLTAKERSPERCRVRPTGR